MKLEVVQERDNPILKRKELLLNIEHTGKATPTRVELLPVIAKQVNVDEKHIIIDYIRTSTGTNNSLVKVQIYQNIENIPREKTMKMAKRTKVKASEKTEEAKKEE
ncbi:MAG: hypothetical protein QXP39_00620 [Candidatus Aenigmatarchaeota archaeon]